MEWMFAVIFLSQSFGEEPVIDAFPWTPFASRELCEEELMTYLSEGYVMTMNGGKLTVSKKQLYADGVVWDGKTATCVAMVKPE